MLRQILFFTWTMLTVATLIVGTSHAEQAPWRAGPFAPLPDLPDVDPRKVHLGETLFHDTRLSADNTISCASCHDLNQGGDDGLQKPLGIKGQEGALNTPTVFNSAYNFSQFWDGRAQNLKEQAVGPVHNPVEMDSNWPEVIVKLKSDPAIRTAFDDLYPDGITGDNIVDAIATFERTLVTLDSPFDRFLHGDDEAISAEAKKGYELFQSYGCAACHQGLNVGGNMYQTMGAMGDYFGDSGEVGDSDQGRFHVTGKEQDRHVFKVPSLRMVAETAPYFHDGQAKTLEQAVELMAKYQLGREMAPEDLGPIVAFLRSLAGEYKRFQP
ncbi:MAG TPA: cytochrome-c peroxidase [Magnetovibrio sp.]